VTIMTKMVVTVIMIMTDCNDDNDCDRNDDNSCDCNDDNGCDRYDDNSVFFL